MQVIREQLIEIIEWVTDDPNLLMYKFADADKEIKNGAQLIVRESQQAHLLNEGKLADTFAAGRQTLSTANIPLLSSLKGWKDGFESPFKADVYFFSTQQFIDLKWGTPAPILMRDPEFKQVRVRAFGSFGIRISDVGRFFKQYAGTCPRLTIFELEKQLRDLIASRFGELLASSNLSVLDVAGNLTALSQRIEPMLKPYFDSLGIELTQFIIASATLPDEVTAYYDKVTGMHMVGDLDRFQKFSCADAIGSPGSGMRDAVQQGAMLNMMMAQMQAGQAARPLEAASDDITAKLTKLKGLFDQQLIDEAEYRQKKSELLERL